MSERKMNRSFEDSAQEILDGVCSKPEIYATDKGEMVAIVWTVLTLHAASIGHPTLPRIARGIIFPGPQMISPRYNHLSMRQFGKVLNRWIEEYQEQVEMLP
jgi:hypothetical protein